MELVLNGSIRPGEEILIKSWHLGPEDVLHFSPRSLLRHGRLRLINWFLGTPELQLVLGLTMPRVRVQIVSCIR